MLKFSLFFLLSCAELSCSLAGRLGLGKLIAFWDDNSITIDGDTKGWFTENVAARYRAYGWQVIEDVDGHNQVAIAEAIRRAQADNEHPTLICCRTQIGFGSPNKAGKASAHGAPLGDAEIAQTRAALKWPYAPFEIPETIYEEWNAEAKGQASEDAWSVLFEGYQQAHPQLAVEFTRRMIGELPLAFEPAVQKHLHQLVDDMPKVATRKASQMALEAMCPVTPELFGGSADLTGSNLTNWSGAKWLNHSGQGDYLSYGVREFGMSAIMNGIFLHGGFRPFGGTFLVFSDYARNAMRMSALMKLPIVYVMTHDSIGLGEDGPTHQPVEHVSSLRLIPNMHVWRPADAFETQVAWKVACEQTEIPSTLALSRQGLPALIQDVARQHDVAKGGYALRENADADIVLLASGSEVEVMLAAADQLSEKGIQAQVVSMPCMEIFKSQSDAYQDAVLLPHLPAVAMEAGSTGLWHSLLPSRKAIVLGLDVFGESAPAADLYQLFGLTPENVIKKVETLLNTGE